MNIAQGLSEHMSPISRFSGICLSIEEEIKLQTTLDQLKSDIKCDEMLFWGKVNGIEKDYYIALALYYKGYQKFPKKVFFFATSSNFVFSELPPIQKHQLKDFHKFNTYFIGNPDIILQKYDDVEEKSNHILDEEIENGVFNPVPKLKNLTESDRLSFVVRTIDNDTSVVPVGGFKMLPISEMRRNDIFEGLTTDQIGNIKNYLHFRYVLGQDKRDLIEMGKGVFDFAFLDCLADDELKGSWSIQLDSSKTVSHIRSLIWPGYFAYHIANTDLFGGIYIGYGVKNIDIPFMQQ